ncbi:MAG: hypothetical protein OXP09_21340 [Gammaproteobacteria bacterium]|nr:hypothetical protein [Rhodospirillaceae bacterium]MDE0368101.1 hypothetical protein [Gammaproteobacteria bacterium]
MPPTASVSVSGAIGKTGTLLTVFCVFAGLVITAYGLVQQDWPAVLPFWRPGATMGYLGFVASCALAIALARIVLRANYFASTTCLGMVIVLFGEGVASLLSVLYFLAASWSLGFIAIKAICRPDPPTNESARALVGAGLWATGVSLTAHFEINTGWVYSTVLALPIAAARHALIDLVRKIADQTLHAHAERRHIVERSLLGALFLTFLAFAYLPELAHDPLAVHLFVPGYVEANHAWDFDPARYVWTLMPLLADWAYTIGFLLGGEAAAKLVNLAFLMACAHLVRQLVLTLGGSERGADWGALVLLSTPLTFLLGSALYAEPFWSAYLLAGALFVFRVFLGRGNRLSQLKLAAILLAFSAASKAVALVILPIVLAMLIPRAPGLLAKGSRLSAFGAAGLFLALGGIPYLVAWFISGNPVFPFYNGLFQSPFYPAENFLHSGFDSDLSWKLPYQLVFLGGNFTSGMTGSTGAAGFQWLLLLVPSVVAALFLRDWKAASVAGVCLLPLLVIFEFQTFLRYVFPSFLFLSALIGLAISRCTAAGPTVRWAMVGAAGLTLGLNLLFYGSCSPNYRDVPVLEIFDPEGREEIVRRRAPIRKAVELVEELNQSRSPVVFLAPPLAAGLTSDALFASWYNRTFDRELRSSRDYGSFVSLIQKHGARFLIADSRWRGHREGVAGFVDQAFREVARFGSVSLHRVDDSVFFADELLTGTTELSSPPWQLREGTEVQGDGTVLVTATSPVTQSVPVEPGRRYLNEITAKCADQPARGRVQVSWRDAQWNPLGTEIASFHCRTGWVVESLEVTAPQGAANAVVFGAGHTATPVRISEISFRTNARQPVPRTGGAN